jgi:hypothetical protein
MSDSTRLANLKLNNAQRRQICIESLAKAPESDRQSLIVANSVAELGELMSEWLGELVEDIERLNTSLLDRGPKA